jgi:pimeloyl-ACP methyl ester carboxylesterase
MTVSPGEYTLKVRGLDLWYKVVGNGPVLIVQPPGWGVGVGLYEQTFRPLESEFTLIYYDTPGSGRSQTPANSEDINVGAFVEDLEALRTHLDLDFFALIGHSHGGYIALNYALKYQRHVSHLLPLDAQLGVEEPGQDLQRTLPELAKDPRLADASKAFGEPWRLESDRDLVVLLERILPLYFRNPEGEGLTAFREYVRMNRIAVTTMQATDTSDGRFLVRDKLNTIHVPTLVLVGRHDFICSPVQAQIIHESIRGSKLAVFEKSGHFPWLEEPDLFFSTVTNFLKGNPADLRSRDTE